MALEAAQYINGLNPSNPSGADRLHQGDDHIRTIKSALKNTFPYIEGPVTLTAEEINKSPRQVPIGSMVMWPFALNTIPTGWGLCDGTAYTRTDGAGSIQTPPMHDRIPIGAGPLVDPGEATGRTDYTLNTGSSGAHVHTVTGGAHSHAGQVGATALTVDQIPAHKHLNGVVDKDDSLFNHGGAPADPTKGDSIDGNSSSGTREGYTTSTGKGQTHTHTLAIDSATHAHELSSEGAHTHSIALSVLPPVFGVYFIMKI